MRKIFAIWVAKILVIVGKLVGKKGSSLPGAVALKICPNILRDLAGKMEEIVVTCGTNGKTTTNNLIYSILRKSERHVVCNNVGANMLPGVVCAFAAGASVFGKSRARFACIELDEFSAPKVFEHINPNFMIITNLFRDQLDRYGEIDIAYNALVKAARMHPECELILNADDSIVASIGEGFDEEKVHYFGVGESVQDDVDELGSDGLFCKKCGGELEYEYRHYSQLGKFSCPNCGFVRPKAEFEAEGVILSPKMEFNVAGQHFAVSYRGFYNIYNILASFAAARLIGCDTDIVQEVLDEYRPQIARMQEFDIDGKKFVLNLSKNPAGFNQAIKTVMTDSDKKTIIVAINDNAQDGTDISWIWDVEFEKMSAYKIIATGIRRDDVLVRLKYAQVKSQLKVQKAETVREALEMSRGISARKVYVLVNYTAIFETEKLLKKMRRKYGN